MISRESLPIFARTAFTGDLEEAARGFFPAEVRSSGLGCCWLRAAQSLPELADRRCFACGVVPQYAMVQLSFDSLASWTLTTRSQVPAKPMPAAEPSTSGATAQVCLLGADKMSTAQHFSKCTA